MEGIKKIISASLVSIFLVSMLSATAFSASDIAPMGNVLVAANEQEELTEREREVEKKLDELNTEVKKLKENAKKISKAEQKKRETALKRKRAELKKQQEELKKSAEKAKKEAEEAKKEVERLKTEQQATAEEQTAKDKQNFIYACVGGGVALVIILTLVIFFVKRNKRAKELEEELLLSSSEIENYKDQLEAQRKEAQKKQENATVRMPKGGRNAISFVVIKGGMAAAQLSANFDNSLTIGRAPDCGLRLDNEPTVSGHHCEVRCDGIAYYIRDLGSTNGTALNGVAINRSTKINNGDKILLGSLELVVSGLPQGNAPSMTNNLGGATVRQRV